MSQHFFQSAAMRRHLLRAYRLYARSQFWRSGSRVFVNSIPKAGTHLLTSELEGFPTLQNSRLHLEFAKVKVVGRRTDEGYPELDLGKVRHLIAEVRAGQFFSAHLYWSKELMELIEETGVRMVFMARDPRDILVSSFHYIMGLRRHWLHDVLTRDYFTEEARYRLLINGSSGPPFVLPMKRILQGHIPWTREPAVLTTKFEELVGERGGGADEVKRDTLARIAKHCHLPPLPLEPPEKATPKATPTLRLGQANAWRRSLPQPIAELVNREWASEIEALGYSLE